MSAIKIVYTVVSLLLIITILSQARGGGLSATFGGAGEFYAQKRGAEKVLFNITMVLAILFLGISLSFHFV